MKDFNQNQGKDNIKSNENVSKQQPYNQQKDKTGTTQQPLPGKGQNIGGQGIGNKDKGLGGTNKVDFNKDKGSLR